MSEQPEVLVETRPATAKKRTLGIKTKIGGAVAAVALAGASVFGVYSLAAGPSASAQPAAAIAGAGFGPGGGTRGTITAVDGSTLTVSGLDDTATTVSTSDSTTFTELTIGALSDLKVGDNVNVRGTAGDDGVIEAASITDSRDVASAGGPGL